MRVTTDDMLFRSLAGEIAASWIALPDKPDESPELTLRCLWFAAAGKPCSSAASAQGELPVLATDDVEQLRALVARRTSGEPLAYIVGRQRFMGMEMLCAESALIPRSETELLAGVAIDLARAAHERRGEALVADVCTGSGNIALAVANQLRSARVFGADISSPAVQLARSNAANLDLTDRVTFLEGDLLAPLEGEALLGAVDVVVCNPPYVSSGRVTTMPAEISRFEPHLAFDGGLTGTRVIMRLIADAPRYLRPDGALCFEVGAGNGELVAQRVRRHGAFASIETVCDAAGVVRVVTAHMAAH